MILRARKISGPEALRIGLVNEVWPNDALFERARALALELAAMPALAVREMLRCIVGAGEMTLDQAIAEERRAVLSTMGTPDQREGIQAFLEKRRPRFTREADWAVSGDPVAASRARWVAARIFITGASR
jgi:enoyl-CoA hydratase